MVAFTPMRMTRNARLSARLSVEAAMAAPARFLSVRCNNGLYALRILNMNTGYPCSWKRAKPHPRVFLWQGPRCGHQEFASDRTVHKVFQWFSVDDTVRTHERILSMAMHIWLYTGPFDFWTHRDIPMFMHSPVYGSLLPTKCHEPKSSRRFRHDWRMEIGRRVAL